MKKYNFFLKGAHWKKIPSKPKKKNLKSFVIKKFKEEFKINQEGKHQREEWQKQQWQQKETSTVGVAGAVAAAGGPNGKVICFNLLI